MADNPHARIKYLKAEIRRLRPHFKRYQLLFGELVSLELKRRNRDGPRGPARHRGGVWSVDRIRQLPDEEFYRHETDDDIVIVSPRPSPLHQMVSRRITNLLEDAIITAGADLSVAQNVEAITRGNGRQLKVPDILVLTRAAFDKDPEAPKGYDATQIVLAVEISRARHSRRALGEKFDTCAQAGIDHYWIVELSAQPQLTVFTRDGPDEQITVTQNLIHLPRPFPIVLDPPGLLRPPP
jgi:Uma2 family endonuclease